MKKPLSDISLAAAVQSMTAIIGFLLIPFLCMAQEPDTPDTGSGALPNDTINAIMPMSDSEEESFFRGIIPPSPQAAALARYAEYPVSHTTGIPDITIPLYEIDLGGYTLPISISYHASGCRVDDVPTSVGLGWCLNAGGAVTRTVLGAPDLWMDNGSMTDDRFLDPAALAGLVERGARSSAARDTIRSILDGSRLLDTESDRYSYNVAGATGMFRYSYKSNDYVVLTHNNDRITSHGAGIFSRFVISTPSGIEYHLGTQELSGVNYRDEGYSHTSAWYVDSITTPYGSIRFSYSKSAGSLTVNRHAITTEAGLFPLAGEGGEAQPKYEITDHSGTSSVVHDQVLLEEVEWNGNRVRFEYGCDNPGYTPHHLRSMTVTDYNGTVMKTIGFTHTMWESISGYGRRLLTSLEDSSQGTFRFAYHGTAGTKIPSWDFGADSATCSDLWGFYNGYTGDVHVLPTETIDELTRNFQGVKQDHVSFTGRSRSPSLGHTMLGVLESVTFPTGGSAGYAYELNKVTVNSAAYTAGGLRVKSVTVSDGTSSYVKTYSYSGVLSQDPPEKRMVHRTYINWRNVPPLELGVTYLYEYKTAGSYPVDYTYSPSSPVAYTSVVEQRHDGSCTTFTYDCSDMIRVSGVSGYDHPSVYGVSLHDPGAGEPRLLKRTVSDSSGRDVFSETNTYVRINVDEAVPTGSRIYSNLTNADFKLGDRWIGAETELTDERHLFLGATTARAGACLLSAHTETDLTTGFSATTSYTYDTSSGTPLRTTNPRSTTMTDSQGRTLTTTCTYPFDRTDAMCKGMVDFGQTDAVVAVRVTDPDNRVISGKDTEYALYNDMYYPVATRSWSMPTSDGATAVPATLPERERVASYNSLGRPSSITVNATDVTSFTWDTHGQLTTATAPGGLATSYTHTPLFGLESVTEPNGHKTSYDYNAMGLLMRVFDQSQITDSYSYTLVNHPDGEFKAAYNSVISRHYLETTGTIRTIDQQFCDGLGRPSVLAKAGMNTSGKYLYTAQTYDALGRELRSVMPGVGGKTIEAMTAAQVLESAQSTHDDPYAYSETTYDALDRPLKTTTPGTAWHDNGVKGKVTEYVGNKASSVRRYRAPITSITLVEDGYYAASTLQGVRSVDEDGNEMTVYTDRLGRKVLERRGPESGKGQNDTYFVYNDLGQLRYVLSPGYELSGYKEKFAYEYRYDENGNIVKKFIPGGGYTQYWYDRAGRMTFMQDPGLREQGLHRFFLYDKAGRQVIQGLSSSCNRSGAVNFATYSGGTSGFQSTGYTLTEASRIQQASLESVSYYDDYTFVSPLDSRLASSNTGVTSAKGLATGSVTYNSEGGKSLSAIYYDIRGNVTQLREVTDFGTLRVTDNTYTFTNQPLTSKTTEESGGQTKTTLLTENTYHAETGLLLHTDVTVNGTKQRVSSLTYDDLGRITSVARGNGSGSWRTVSYSYNLHGQTTSISGPGFAQTLHYTDGPGKPLYNGSVSSMTWSMHDHRERGYKYTYNGYGWLTLAEYGEGSALSSNKDRYTERFLNFMPNGGIRRLQRHGLKADGNYGKIDNLHISYDGNRITTVLEDAADVTTTGSMDYPGKQREMDFAYNEWGALTKDESRGITNIEYDNFGNPTRVSFSNGSYTKNVYSASGVKLKTEHYTSLGSGVNAIASAIDMDDDANPDSTASAYTDNAISGTERIEYHGPVIYRNGSIDMVQFPGGYATVSGLTVTFHYYTQDYLGNNRAVVNGTSGAIEQTTAYSPYGAVIADLGTGNSGQPFKFIGKELISANGLNVYDHGARLHYPAIPQFDRIDPLCDDCTWLSPYLYCGNNPVNAFDPDGRSTWVTDLGGGQYQVIGGDLNDKDRNVYVYTNDKNGNPTVRGKSIGKTATMYSFYNTNDSGYGGEWATESIIDMNDTSGQDFLSNLAKSNPPLFSDYMVNATNGGIYDFKATNGTSKKNSNLDHYRGMSVGNTKDGVPILASARDVGNIGAGYVAAINGLPWKLARMGFDTYQSISNKRLTIEGLSTQSAEYYGYVMGKVSTTGFSKICNFRQSMKYGIISGIGAAMQWLGTLLK